MSHHQTDDDMILQAVARHIYQHQPRSQPYSDTVLSFVPQLNLSINHAFEYYFEALFRLDSKRSKVVDFRLLYKE